MTYTGINLPYVIVVMKIILELQNMVLVRTHNAADRWSLNNVTPKTADRTYMRCVQQRQTRQTASRSAPCFKR